MCCGHKSPSITRSRPRQPSRDAAARPSIRLVSPIETGAIDCDVHVEPPSMDALLGYIDPYWHEFIRSAHLGIGHRLYPESEPMSARPEARATGSFPPR